MKRVTSLKRLNALDAVLLLLLLLGIASSALRWHTLSSGEDVASLSVYHVLIRFDDLDARLGDCFSVGETVRSRDGELVGQIVSVENKQTRKRLISNGVVYEAVWDQTVRCGLEILIEVRGVERDGVLYLDGRYPIAVAREESIMSERACLMGKIYKYYLV